MNNPMQELRDLVSRFRARAAEPAGFDLQRAVVAPGEPDTLEVVMIISGEMFKDPEQREIDRQFKEMEKQLKVQERTERAVPSDETKTSLEDWLDGK